MVKTNFTLKGELVEVVAYLSDGKPVFSLDIDGNMIMDGISYNKLLNLANSIIFDFDQVRKNWCEEGRELMEFNFAHEEKEESHEQAD